MQWGLPTDSMGQDRQNPACATAEQRVETQNVYPGSAVVRCITRRTGALPPKPLTDDVLRAADIVITMDTSDSLPVYPGKSYEDWAVEDTAGKSLIEV